MNFAENILCRKVEGLAIINVNEDNLSHPDQYSWQDLRDLVAKYAGALKSSGLKRGEVVARMIIHSISDAIKSTDLDLVVGSNCVRSLGLLLATAAVGGVFASFATDMGAKVRLKKHRYGRSYLNPKILYRHWTIDLAC